VHAHYTLQKHEYFQLENKAKHSVKSHTTTTMRNCFMMYLYHSLLTGKFTHLLISEHLHYTTTVKCITYTQQVYLVAHLFSFS